MANEFSNSESMNPEGDAPSVKQAADDLRAAAGEEAREDAHSTGEQAHVLKDRALERARQLRSVAGEKAEEWKSVASGKAEEWKSVAGERAQHLRDSASDHWHETRDKAHDIHVTAEDYIREHPTKCVLGAVGVGFIIGLIVRR